MKYNITDEILQGIQEKYTQLFSEIQEGKYVSYTSYTIGSDGAKRGVYYYVLDSGWYAVITIPYSTLLEHYQSAWKVFLIIMVVFMAIVIISAIVDYRTNQKVQIYNEIVGVLGNSYYALY